jgi:integrase
MTKNDCGEGNGKCAGTNEHLEAAQLGHHPKSSQPNYLYGKGVPEVHARQDIPQPWKGTTDEHFPWEQKDGETDTGYPFFAGIETHLIDSCALQSPKTIHNKRQTLQRIGRWLEEIKQHQELTTDPVSIGKPEVVALIQHMRGLHLDGDSQKKYLQVLGDYLLFNQNSTIQFMKMVHKNQWPRGSKNKPIKTNSILEINNLITACDKIDGWRGEVARFVCYIYTITGVRPSELRTELLEDLSLHPLQISVSNPKGVDTYGERRTIAIDDVYRQVIEQFLEARTLYLSHIGKPCKYLVPRQFKDGHLDCWSQSTWNKLKLSIERASGIDFTWKNLRPSYAKIQREHYGASLEAVSVTLGHSTTTTTEQYYHRIEMGDAQESIITCFNKAKQAGNIAVIPQTKSEGKSQRLPVGDVPSKTVRVLRHGESGNVQKWSVY